MRDTDTNEKTNLTVIKGGRLSAHEFSKLELPAKLDYICREEENRRLKLIIDDRQAVELTRALPAQELYSLLKEVGEESALELLEMATTGQLQFILDIEAWDRFTFSVERAARWLDYFLTTFEDRSLTLLAELDMEFLALFLNNTVIVGGGVRDLLGDEERLADWDHSFDDIYFLKFCLPDYRNLVMRLLDLLFRLDPPLYQALMEETRGELTIELEEICLQLRMGRLADEGFPPLEEAISIYARLNPATFAPASGKEEISGETAPPPLPAFAGQDATLLQRTLEVVDSPTLRRECKYLLNNALVADGITPGDRDGLSSTMERVGGLLNIALEYLSGGDKERARTIITGEHLKRLFQLGYSLLLPLRDRALALKTANYATDKVLIGLRNKRPRFYLGIDWDGADGYREFRELADVRKMERFLEGIGG